MTPSAREILPIVWLPPLAWASRGSCCPQGAHHHVPLPERCGEPGFAAKGECEPGATLGSPSGFLPGWRFLQGAEAGGAGEVGEAEASGLAGSGRVLRRQTARPVEPEPGGGRETRGLAPLLALIPNPCQVVAWPWVRCRSSPPSGGWRESQGLRSGRLRPGPGAPSQAGVLRVPHPANSPRRSGHRGRDGEGVERPALRGV